MKAGDNILDGIGAGKEGIEELIKRIYSQNVQNSNPVHCNTCKENYLINTEGFLSNDKSALPAIDTVDDHSKRPSVKSKKP